MTFTTKNFNVFATLAAKLGLNKWRKCVLRSKTLTQTETAAFPTKKLTKVTQMFKISCLR